METMKQPSIPCNMNVWSLPNEIIVEILRASHIRDLLNLKQVHSHFCDLIENHAALWTSASFEDVWPNKKNIKHFQKAANHGNIEALIKLGIAYLYNEGLPGDFEGKKITENGAMAAAMFCRVESLTPRVLPFTWLFIRPPWSVRGACCKEFVFDNMVKHVQKQNDASVQICIARTLELLDEDETHVRDMMYHLTQAQDIGSAEAAYILWQKRYESKKLDIATELQSLRELRRIACGKNLNATLELCKKYAQQRLGGLGRQQAACFVREFLQLSKPTNVSHMYRFQELTHSMRYILMDWLVEVTNMKDYSSLTLHVAIDVVDRMLKVHKVTRARLQLLGVSAMVLCSRFLGKDIITIREAAWLTDNTYKYEDVVRMMGEITATLRGKFRVVTSFDYLQVISLCAKNSTECALYSEYICELALLQSDMGYYPQAKVAAACVLLARLSLGEEHPWPEQMELFTGFKVADLKSISCVLRNKCFSASPMTDHRNIELRAVKLRYEDLGFHSVSAIPIICSEALCDFLGTNTTQQSQRVTNLNSSTHMNAAFISSPCRHSNKEEHDISIELSPGREKTATPTFEKNLTEQFNNILNKSFTACHLDAETANECVANKEQRMETADDDCGNDLNCRDNYNFYEKSSCESSPITHAVKITTELGSVQEQRSLENPVVVVQGPEFEYCPEHSEESRELQENFNTSLHIEDSTSRDSTEVNTSIQNHDLQNKESNKQKSDSNIEAFFSEFACEDFPAKDITGKENDLLEVNSKSDISIHSTPHCGTSPVANLRHLNAFNASPIGGMSFFKVDAPTTRYINSGVKIDFQNTLNSSSSGADFTTLNQSTQSMSAKNGENIEFQVFGSSKQLQPVASTPTARKTFSIFQDPDYCHSNSSVSKSTTALALKDLDFNVVADQYRRTRRQQKRRPSGSLGNDTKKKIL